MSTDTLEFPTIDAPAQPRTEVATAAAAALDLQRLDLNTIALAGFGDWRATLAATTANLSTLALDLSTAAKCKEARSLRQRLIGDPMAEARKVAAGVKSKMAATSKVVGAELGAIESAYQQADQLILPKIEAREQELEAERLDKARKEAERKAAHEGFIATIRAYLTHCQQPGMTSDRIANGIAALEAITIGPEREEYAVPAANAQCETLEAMRRLHAQVLGREQEAERQDRIRAENERVAAELAAERKRIDAEAAELRRQAALLAAQQQPITQPNSHCRESGAQPGGNTGNMAHHTDDAAPVGGLAEGEGATALSPGSVAQPVDEVHEAAPAGGLLQAVAELVALVDEARGGRFPTQPKPGPDWWARLYAVADRLQGAAS